MSIKEPPGVAALPHDARGIPIPVHVGRPVEGPVKITDYDARRLLLIAAERRCTICGWEIQDGESFWYFSWPLAIAQLRESGWTGWDTAKEGAGHKECMLYSALACPWVSDPNYARRAPQMEVGIPVRSKGEERGAINLAGAPTARVHLPLNEGDRFEVRPGGGKMEVLDFEHGSELAGLYDEVIAACTRQPTKRDESFVKRLTQDDVTADIDVWHFQVQMELLGELGVQPDLGRAEPCPCESGSSYKRCCRPRVAAGAAYAQRRSGQPRVLDPRF